jgi:integrase
MLNTAVAWGLMESSPLRALKPLREDKSKLPRFLSDEEESALKAALDRRELQVRSRRASANTWRSARSIATLPTLHNLPYVDYFKPLILLALNTGLRRGELFELSWSDIDFATAHLRVRGTHSKSGQSRAVPLCDEAREALIQWRRSSNGKGLVFPSSRTGKPLVTIKTAWKKLLLDAGISDFRFHDLRHTFASKLVMRKTSINTVRALMGHSDIAMTLRYAHLSSEHLVDAISVLNEAPRILAPEQQAGRRVQGNDGLPS